MITPNRITHAANAAYGASNAEYGPRSTPLSNALFALAQRLGNLLNGMATADDIRAAVADVNHATDSIATTDATVRAIHHANAVAVYDTRPPTAGVLAADLEQVAQYAADDAYTYARLYSRRACHDDDAYNPVVVADAVIASRALRDLAATAQRTTHENRNAPADARRAVDNASDAVRGTHYGCAGDEGGTALALADALAYALANAITYGTEGTPGGLDPAPEAPA